MLKCFYPVCFDYEAFNGALQPFFEIFFVQSSYPPKRVDWRKCQMDFPSSSILIY